jgi:hypothetical protein
MSDFFASDFVDNHPWIIPVGILLLSAVMVVGLWAISLPFERAACFARWERSGSEVSWGVMAGCQVRQPDGTWLPEKALRQFREGAP